jgi:homogentisate 1,2-dioxygenase
MVFTLTDYAMKRSGKLHGQSQALQPSLLAASTVSAEHKPKMWDDLKGQFMNHLDRVNLDLGATGLLELGKK